MCVLYLYNKPVKPGFARVPLAKLSKPGFVWVPLARGFQNVVFKFSCADMTMWPVESCDSFFSSFFQYFADLGFLEAYMIAAI